MIDIFILKESIKIKQQVVEIETIKELEHNSEKNLLERSEAIETIEKPAKHSIPLSASTENFITPKKCKANSLKIVFIFIK